MSIFPTREERAYSKGFSEASEHMQLFLDIANTRIADLEWENERLQKDNDDFQSSFDLRHKADMRAIKRWQAETGKDLAWPDHADLCVWLLEKNEHAESQLRALREDGLGKVRCPDNAGGVHRWDGDGQCKDCCNYATDLIDRATKRHSTEPGRVKE